MEVVREGKNVVKRYRMRKQQKKRKEKKCFNTMGKVKRAHEILCPCLHLPLVVPPSLATTMPTVW